MAHRRRVLRVAAVVGAVTLACAGAAGPSPQPRGPERPNIVYVLTDDLSANLVPYMPHVQAMAREGAAFSNYSVTDSLCCPSRSTIMTGRFPHNTGVFTNTAPDGGYGVFRDRGNEQHTFATALRAQGYRTGMYGKYMNEFPAGREDPPVPAGWNQWHVSDNGYPEYDYVMDENARRVHYGSKPRDYLTDVVAAKSERFIRRNAGAAPFLLEVATFAPHEPFTPAPRHDDSFPGLKAPRGPDFDRVPENSPPWLADREPLRPDQRREIDESFRERVRSVQAVDEMIGRLQRTLAATGQDRNTYFVFNSDNGYHLGEHRLPSGKQTVFDTDVRVPLVVTGPGVPAGRRIPEVASNIDLSPTFQDMAGAAPPREVDGRSLLPLLRGENPPGWRTAALVEHHGPNRNPADPDRPAEDSANPPTYTALRTDRFTYVEYVDGGREFYDRSTDPDQLHNTYAALPESTQDDLHRRTGELRRCRGTESCERAAR